MITGNIDVFNRNEIHGWILDTSFPSRPIQLRVVLNGKKIIIEASQPRTDIAELYGDQAIACGFYIDLTPFIEFGINQVLVEPVEVDFQFGSSKKELLYPEYLDLFKSELSRNADYFRFPSDLESNLKGKILFRTIEGQERLNRLLTNTKIILVLFSNRTGSNLVTDMLESCGLGAGATNEPFLSSTIMDVSGKWNIHSIDSYICETIEEWTRNHTCFLKISWDALFLLLSENVINELIKNATFIWVRRQDKIAQALSNIKAKRTGIYFQTEEKIESQSWDDLWNQEISLLNIAREIHNNHVSDSRLNYFLTLFDFDYHEVFYENMISDMQKSLDLIVRFLCTKGIVPKDSDISTYIPRLSKQSSSEDTKIKEIFLKSMASTLTSRPPRSCFESDG